MVADVAAAACLLVSVTQGCKALWVSCMGLKLCSVGVAVVLVYAFTGLVDIGRIYLHYYYNLQATFPYNANLRDSHTIKGNFIIFYILILFHWEGIFLSNQNFTYFHLCSFEMDLNLYLYLFIKYHFFFEN